MSYCCAAFVTCWNSWLFVGTFCNSSCHIFSRYTDLFSYQNIGLLMKLNYEVISRFVHWYELPKNACSLLANIIELIYSAYILYCLCLCGMILQLSFFHLCFLFFWIVFFQPSYVQTSVLLAASLHSTCTLSSVVCIVQTVCLVILLDY